MYIHWSGRGYTENKRTAILRSLTIRRCNRKKRKEPQNLGEYNKRFNIHVIGIRKEEKEEGAEKVFKVITAQTS